MFCSKVVLLLCEDFVFQDYFEFEYPLYPDLTLKKKLDFEKTASMEIEIMAKV